MTDQPISFDVLHPNPLFLVISGPSGVGKDAVLKELKSRELPLHFIITATTRKARSDELEGVDYFFKTYEQFERMIADDQFIEYAQVYDDLKGIPKQQVTDAFASGMDVIIRVDVQGAAKLRSIFPEAILIMLIPHDEAEWRLRLENRRTETQESYRNRVEKAREEMKKLDLFDYVVMNAHDRLSKAVDTICAIIDAEHHRNPPRKVSL